MPSVLPRTQILSNAEIADRLASLAQLLSAQKENSYKVKAYQRAAAKIRTLSESVDQLVRDDADLTAYAGIGNAISSAIREIVLTGTLGKLEELRFQATPELAAISAYPRLDPKRRAEAVRDYRRRLEVIEDLVFLVETADFAAVTSRLERYGGRMPLLTATEDSALYALSSGILLRVHAASKENWGLSLVRCTGSKVHLRGN